MITAMNAPCAPCLFLLIINYQLFFMKLLKKPSTEKIGNLIITIITALVSTFFMQSCMSMG